MLTEHHDLLSELPDHKETIVELKNNNNHFSKLYDKYDDLNKDILRFEKGVEATSDDHLEDLKKQRLALKDEMMGMITKAEA